MYCSPLMDWASGNSGCCEGLFSKIVLSNHPTNHSVFSIVPKNWFVFNVFLTGLHVYLTNIWVGISGWSMKERERFAVFSWSFATSMKNQILCRYQFKYHLRHISWLWNYQKSKIMALYGLYKATEITI